MMGGLVGRRAASTESRAYGGGRGFAICAVGRAGRYRMAVDLYDVVVSREAAGPTCSWAWISYLRSVLYSVGADWQQVNGNNQRPAQLHQTKLMSAAETKPG